MYEHISKVLGNCLLMLSSGISEKYMQKLWIALHLFSGKEDTFT